MEAIASGCFPWDDFFADSEELEGDAKWKALDLIVDHSAGEGWASQLRPMTSAEVQSTRVLKLKLEALKR